jgi:hypothetical protein
MPNYVQEVGNGLLLNATGFTTITSGKSVVLGFAFFGTGTGGIQLFAAGSTASASGGASVTPMITFCATSSAVAAGLSPMYMKFPMTVSGSGLTANLLPSSDPNIMLFWNPDAVI